MVILLSLSLSLFPVFPPLSPPVSDKRMFGVPLSINIRNTGQAVPPAILHAIQHLRDSGGLDTKGLFRRAAAKAKIELLKVTNEANPCECDFSIGNYSTRNANMNECTAGSPIVTE